MIHSVPGCIDILLFILYINYLGEEVRTFISMHHSFWLLKVDCCYYL